MLHRTRSITTSQAISIRTLLCTRNEYTRQTIAHGRAFSTKNLNYKIYKGNGKKNEKDDDDDGGGGDDGFTVMDMRQTEISSQQGAEQQVKKKANHRIAIPTGLDEGEWEGNEEVEVEDEENHRSGGSHSKGGTFKTPSKRFMKLLSHANAEDDGDEEGGDGNDTSSYRHGKQKQSKLSLDELLSSASDMDDAAVYDTLLRQGGINPEKFKSYVRSKSDTQLFNLLDTQKSVDENLSPEEQEALREEYKQRMKSMEEAQRKKSRRNLLKNVLMESDVMDQIPESKVDTTEEELGSVGGSFAELFLTEDQYIYFIGLHHERAAEFEEHIVSISSELFESVTIENSNVNSHYRVLLHWNLEAVEEERNAMRLKKEKKLEEKRKKREKKREKKKVQEFATPDMNLRGLSSKQLQDMADMEDLIRQQIATNPDAALSAMTHMGISGKDLRTYMRYIMEGGIHSRLSNLEEAEDDGMDSEQVQLTPEEKAVLDAERERERRYWEVMKKNDPLIMDNKIYEEYEDEFDKYQKIRKKSERDRYLKEQFSKMNIPSLQLPWKLVDRVQELVNEYPRNSLRKTARLLSATFRIRTGGHGNLYMFTDEDAKAAKEREVMENQLQQGGKTNITVDNRDIYKQQLDLLQQLQGYKRKARHLNTSSQPTHSKSDQKGDDALAQQPQIIYGELEAVAYIAHRLPAVYATSYRIFQEIKKRLPDFRPQSMLDFGTGPGTSIWAARDVWLPEKEDDDGNKVLNVPEQNGTLEEIMAVEPSSAMMDIAMRLMQPVENDPDHIQRRRSHLTWRRFHNENSRRKYDVVMASFVLNEIADERERERVIKSLWNSTQGVLVFVEPGTPLGSKLIEQARQIVLGQKDTSNPMKNPTTLAPYPHDAECPIAKKPNTWCHFSQRVEREPFQKTVKEGITKGYEDEKFSFVVLKRFDMRGICTEEEIEEKVYDYAEHKALTREKGEISSLEIQRRLEWERSLRQYAEESHRWPRIVNRPLKKGGHTLFDLCTPEGTLLEKVTITKSDQKWQGGYKYSRQAFWGDLFPLDWLNNTRLLKVRKEKLRQRQMEEAAKQDPSLMLRAQMFGEKKASMKKQKSPSPNPEMDDEEVMERLMNMEREHSLNSNDTYQASKQFRALAAGLQRAREENDRKELEDAHANVTDMLDRVRLRREKREKEREAHAMKRALQRSMQMKRREKNERK